MISLTSWMIYDLCWKQKKTWLPLSTDLLTPSKPLESTKLSTCPYPPLMTLLSLPSWQLSLEERSHLTPDLGTVPIHNAFPIDSTHAALLRNYPLLPLCLDDLKHKFEQHQMEQYLIFDIDTGLMEYQPQKTQRYQFHPYTSIMSTSSSRRTPSHLIKLNDNIH